MTEPTVDPALVVALSHEGSPEHIAQFFTYDHLPPRLQEVSKPFCDLAKLIVEKLPKNPQREYALQRLMESKDAAVRTLLAKP